MTLGSLCDFHIRDLCFRDRKPLRAANKNFDLHQYLYSLIATTYLEIVYLFLYFFELWMETDLSPCQTWRIPKDGAIDRAYSDLIVKANFLVYSKTRLKGHCPLQQTLNWIPFADTQIILQQEYIAIITLLLTFL